MSAPGTKPVIQNPLRAREHLANERTFLAWLRTGMSAVIFGFAISRFGLALRMLGQIEGHGWHTPVFSMWFGMASIGSGVFMVIVGWIRYRHVRHQLDSRDEYQPAGFVIDLLAVTSALCGMALAIYVIFYRA